MQTESETTQQNRNIKLKPYLYHLYFVPSPLAYILGRDTLATMLLSNQCSHLNPQVTTSVKQEESIATPHGAGDRVVNVCRRPLPA
ncbi:hypothetical protein TNCV_4209611 [Trichonephila clavipes]|nr:hypothetical protein TNCV_4209611 [Trichonephila clavipes]